LLFLGDAVAAAGAGFVLAVRQDLLALTELDLLVGPKDAVAHAVGDIDQAILVESDDTSIFYIEIGIMGSDDRVVVGCRFKFLGAFDASRNYGV
jgi:hypothetical protein